MAANSKKEIHIFGKKNDQDDGEESENDDSRIPSPDNSQSSPLAVEGEESTEYRLLPPEETPFVAEVVKGNLDRQSNMSLTENNSETLQTGKFQNPFLHGSESTARGNDPNPTSGRLLSASAPVNIAVEFQNMSAIGGAVGALVLGAWSIIGAMITPWSSINAMIAILLGIYGLRSKRKRLSILGIALAVAGLVLSLMELNELLSTWFDSETTMAT